MGAMGMAIVSVLWAYDGWGDLSFAAGEVKDPQRTLPRAIILGTLALIAIYVLTNIAYLYVITNTDTSTTPVRPNSAIIVSAATSGVAGLAIPVIGMTYR